MNQSELKAFLEEKHDTYNSPSFIESDPISIPHQFTLKEDIEISAFLSATIAWGQRVTIINNAKRLMLLMDNSPYDFILNHQDSDLKKLEGFVHRTFNVTDLLYFIHSLQNIYQNRNGLEGLLTARKGEHNLKEALFRFRMLFFEKEYLPRTQKHVSNPMSGSACKRLNMFLRWMVRQDQKGVDFGIWSSISPSLLSCPLDVHTGNIARKLGLLTRKQNDWRAVEELDIRLREFDAEDPVKYDFALFGLGAFEKF